MSKEMIQDDSLNKVVGGYMNFNYYTKVLTYWHEETHETRTYQILDFENAWKTSNLMHGQNKHEDVIIGELIAKGYIK